MGGRSINAQWAEQNWDLVAKYLASRYPNEVHETLVSNGYIAPINIEIPQALPGTMEAHLIALAEESGDPSEYIAELALSLID